MGGRRIDDHSSWVGKGSNGNVFPDGAKTKSFTSATGAGSLSTYEDTEQSIKSNQEKSISKAKSNGMKPGYRN